MSPLVVSPADAYLAMAAEAVKATATDPYLPFYLYNFQPNRQTRCWLSKLAMEDCRSFVRSCWLCCTLHTLFI